MAHKEGSTGTHQQRGRRYNAADRSNTRTRPKHGRSTGMVLQATTSAAEGRTGQEYGLLFAGSRGREGREGQPTGRLRLTSQQRNEQGAESTG